MRKTGLWLLLAPLTAACALFCACALLPEAAGAAVPVKITYQGNVRQNGNLVTGQRSIVFRVYDSSTAAAALWTSAAFNVSVSTGVFKVDLEPAIADWESGSLWLELEIEGVRLAPRDQLTSSPYAVNALLHSGKKYTTSGTAPASPALGDLWMDSANGLLKYWAGSAWYAGGSVGDNLGNHTATQDLALAGFDLDSAGYVTASSAALSGQLIAYGTSTLSGDVGLGAGLYVAGASTFASGAYFTGVSSFGNVGNVHFAGGTAGQVLAKVAGGGMEWANLSAMVTGDSLGTHVATKTLDMAGFNISNVGHLYAGGITGTGPLTMYSSSTFSGLLGADTIYVTGVSSFTAPVYFTGVSSFSNVANVHFAGGSAGQVLAKAAGGGMEWSSISAMVTGDSLGTHVATKTLDMANFNITGANLVRASSANFTNAVTASSFTATGIGFAGSQLALGGNVVVSSESSSALGAGVRISSNVYVVGFASATRFYGDGSGLTGITAAAVAAGNVTAGALGANVIASSIAVNAVYTGAILDSAVTDGKIAGMSSSKLSGALPAISGASLTNLTAANISAGTLGAGVIASSVAAGTVYDGSIRAGAVGNAAVASGIDAAKLSGILTVSSVTATGIGFYGPQLNLAAGVGLSSASAAQYGGVYVSSHIYTPGNIYAARFAGDGSALTGVIAASAPGDSLGTHVATRTLDMANFNIAGANQITASSASFTNAVTASSFTATGAGFAGSQLALGSNVIVSSESSAALGAGVRVSTNVYIVGFASATKFYGDGSSLTGIAGDNLGNHTATRNLGMANFDIAGANYISASSAALSGQLIVYGTSTLAGNVGLGAGLNVAGTSTFTAVYATGGSTFTSGAYFTGVSSFSNVANVHYAGGSAGQVLSKVSGGGMQWSSVSSLVTGDSLGTHVATKTLDMANFNIAGANQITASSASFANAVTASSFTATGIGFAGSQLALGSNVIVSSESSAALGAGVRVSSNVYIVGFASATRFYGDGSALTGIAGDNLGDHVATTALDMAQFALVNVTTLTVANTGLHISTGPGITSNGIFISSTSAIYTTGVGMGATLPGTRGYGAVDLQTYRTSASQVAGYSYSTISGGSANMIQAVYATVSGGQQNTASGTGAVVSGGYLNTASGHRATVSGGDGNTASDTFATVSGGNSNLAKGQSSIVAGGSNNRAMGVNSMVSGGAYNTADSLYSWAGGYYSSSTANGAFTWSDSKGFKIQNNSANRSLFKNEGGFMVAGSTVGGSATLPDNLGMLDIVSTGTAADVYAQIWRDSDGVPRASMTATGVLYATMPPGTGDNLGTHTAGMALNMSNFNITGANNILASSATFTNAVTASSFTATGIGFAGSQLALGSNVIVSSETDTALGAGVRVSSNVYIVGFASATKFYGDGSALTGIAGDNLGNHVATTTLDMAQFALTNVSSVAMLGSGLRIATDLTGTAYGVLVSTYGSIVTIGAGHPGSVAPDARGVGAVDLQTYRLAGSSVASGDYSVVAGGRTNAATALYAAVAGGNNNTASGGRSVIAGGSGNVASGGYSVVGGGQINYAGGLYSGVLAGYGNTVAGESSSVAGGVYNVVSGSNSAVGGGAYNTVPSTGAVVAGGELNTASNQWSAVGGGLGNAASGNRSYVGGGYQNIASDNYTVVAGGYQNTASNSTASVLGGWRNVASGSSSISGGYASVSSGFASVVSGGQSGKAAGTSSVVPGGRENTALGDYSLAAGYKSSSTASGTFTWADSQGVQMLNPVQDRTLFKNSGGFLVTGSTNTAMTGAADRGVFITGNGFVGISTGAPQAALDVVPTGNAVTDFGQIWRNASGTIVASMTATGVLYATLPAGTGDGLGSHIAGMALNMAGFNIINADHIMASSATFTDSVTASSFTATGNGFAGNGAALANLTAANIDAGTLGAGVIASSIAAGTVYDGAIRAGAVGNAAVASGVDAAKLTGVLTVSSVTATGIGFAGSQLALGSNVIVSSETDTALGAGVRVSSNVYIVGFASATRFYGDGSALTGIAGDNLGDHIATTTLDMAQFAVVNITTLAVPSETAGLHISTGGTGSLLSTDGLYINPGKGMYFTGEGNNWAIGNARGTGAVDLQTNRNDVAHVASGNYSVISGGSRNTASATNSTVSGGWGNTASNTNTTVSGGNSNTAGATYATVSGGQSNAANGQSSTVSGGSTNVSTNTATTVSGGSGNKAVNSYAAIPGGRNNTASGQYSLAAGYYSSSTANGAFTWSDSKGYRIVNATADRSLFKNEGGFMVAGSTVGGSATLPDNLGMLDIVSTGTAADVYAQIWRDSAGVPRASMTATGVLYADGSALTGIAGDNLGDHVADMALDMANFAITNVSTITMQGDGIRISTSVTAGANGILISTTGAIITVGRGQTGSALPNARGVGAVDLQTYRVNGASVASGDYAVISGGYNNAASGVYTTASGGQNNAASGAYATVSGGYVNTASNQFAAVSGGYGNTASNQYAAVSGGYTNTASGYMATVSGGRENTALGDYSLAAGYKSSSTASGTFTWADSQGVQMLNPVQDRTLFKNSGGFMVTGSTNTAMTGTADRGVFITGNGFVGISTGVPQAALDVVPTGNAVTDFGQIWRNASGTIVASMTATGVLYATLPAGTGDGMGSHLAGMALDMAGFDIINAGHIRASSATFTNSVTASSFTATGIGFAGSQLTLANNVIVSSESDTALGAGVRISSNVYIVGFASATKFYGDGSGLTGIAGDNLGSHIAATTLNLNTFNIVSVGSVTASLGSAAAPAYTFVGNSDTGLYADAADPESLYIGVGGYEAARFLEGPGAGQMRTVFGGNVSFRNGTAASPSINNYSSENTGMFFPTTTSLAFSANGAEAMRVISGGNVGISTNTPEARLDVKAAGATAADMAQIWRDSTGAIISSVSATGVMMASRFIGDGSGLSGVLHPGEGGDDLGSHVATTTLNMAGFAVSNVSTITIMNGAVAIVPAGTAGSNALYGISIGSDSYNNYDSGVGIGRQTFDNYGVGVGIGLGSYRNYNSGVGVGQDTSYNHTNGVGVGNSAANNYNGGVGMGGYAYDNYNYGVGVGYGASLNNNYGTGVGYNSQSNANYAVGVGAYSRNNKTFGSALGAYSYAASSSVALGSYAKANAERSLALGNQTVNNSTGTASFGYYAVHTSSYVMASSFTATGDLGIGAAQVKLAPNVMVSSESAASLGAGVRVSSNVYIVGFASATRFYGDGSGLTGIAGDNLGNHVATTTLDMAGFSLVNVTTIAATSTGIHLSTGGTGSILSTNGLYIDPGKGMYFTGKGNGAVIGNARGTASVDLQTNRTASSQVASGSYAVIAGGSGGTASGSNSVVGGGATNLASGVASTVAGGNAGSATANSATVSGGSNNTASGLRSTVSGGWWNYATGDSSMVPGGRFNTAIGAYSFAAGWMSSSTVSGAFTWSDSHGFLVQNDSINRTLFKNEGGFMVVGSTVGGVSSLPANQGMLDIVSTGTASSVYAQVWRDSDGVVRASMTADGKLYANISGATGLPAGDNLGNHTATTTLDMANFAITNISTITTVDGSIAIVPPGTAGQNHTYGISIGSNSYNNHSSGVGVGRYANNNYNSGVGIGYNAYNNYTAGVGVGYNAYGNYASGVGIGNNAYNNADVGVGIGYNAYNNYTAGVGIGYNAYGNDNYAVGIGAESKNNQPYGAALGAYSYAASSSVALGYLAKANAWNSVAIGSGTVNNSTGTASFGMLAVYTSSNVTAAKFYGDGSALTGIAGDNLGSHVATTTLDMAQFAVTNVSTITMPAGLYISTGSTAGSSGIFISTYGSIMTMGAGHPGTVAPSARGVGAVDLQTDRDTNTDVAAGDYSTISGGRGNFTNTSSSYSTISGGYGNYTQANYASIGGGYQNNASGAYAAIAGGSSNFATGQFSSVVGGNNNSASGYSSSAGGGRGNRASGQDATIGGGFTNVASGVASFVGGGYVNSANGLSSVVVGGSSNTAKGNYSLAAGYLSSSTAVGAFTWSDSQGVQNDNSVADSVRFKARGGFMVTGSTNTNMTGTADRGVFITGDGLVGISTGVPAAALDVVPTGDLATDYGQIWRNASGAIVASMTATGKLYADISGAAGLPAGDNLGDHVADMALDMAQFPITNVSSITISGDGIRISTSVTAGANGIWISTTGAILTVGRGQTGSVLPNARGVGAVDLQTYRVNAASVASGNYAVISGGYNNAASGAQVTVSGGYNNTASGAQAVISGGFNNLAGANQSTISGGQNNTASGSGYAVVAGGANNKAINQSAAISGGENNTASGFGTTISGGANHKATNNYGTVSGGTNNTASGNRATVSGGEWNTAHGAYSWAAGYYSSSTAQGAFTWTDSQGTQMDNAVADRTVFKNRGGFLVTGSTNTAMTGTADRGVFITGDGLVGISTGVPAAALDVVPTGDASSVYSQIWRNASGVIKASMTADGKLYADISGAAGLPAGDNLGDHTADMALDMEQFAIVDITTLAVPSATAGLHISTGGTGSLLSTDGLYINPGKGIYFTGKGNGAAAGDARGTGAVDLQTYRTLASSVATGAYSVIAGGRENWASAANSAVLGGSNNLAGGTTGSSVGGGTSNSVMSDNSFISGGIGNLIYGNSQGSGITGGTSNTINNDSRGSIILGGENNRINAFSWYATVVGGLGNKAGYQGTAIGGWGNSALGAYSIAMGGNNTTVGSYAFAAGNASSSTANGTFTWADSAGLAMVNSVADRTVFKNAGGFLVTGSTNTNMTGPANRGVFITGNGLVGISTGVPQAALDVVPTGDASSVYSQIWRNASGVIKASMTADGKLYADISGAAGLPAGDNLGDHVATTTLQMGAYGINSSSAVSAAVYQINGSTVLLQSVDNLKVGLAAGSMMMGGADNTLLGSRAGFNITATNENTYVGSWAGYKNRGSGNTTVGFQTSYGTGLGPTFNNTTMLGYQAGYNGNDGADANIFVGYKAGYSVATGSGNIVIGYDQRGAAADTMKLNIGGLIYGDLEAKTIGISTRVPQAALDIVSTGTAADQMAQVWRDSDGTIVSSMSATGVMMASKFVGDGASLTNVLSNAPVYTKAQMNTLAASAAGRLIVVSDASANYSYCVSTGTAAGAWVLMNQTLHCQ